MLQITSKFIGKMIEHKRFRRGNSSGSVYRCTKLTALDYVNGDDMRHCGGLGLRWGEQGWGYYSEQTIL